MLDAAKNETKRKERSEMHHRDGFFRKKKKHHSRAASKAALRSSPDLPEGAIEEAIGKAIEKAAADGVDAKVTVTVTVTASSAEGNGDAAQSVPDAAEPRAEGEDKPAAERPRIKIGAVKRFAPAYHEEDFYLPDPLHRESGLVLTAHAAEQLRDMIDWGERTERNCVEQQGIMLGEVFETPYGFTGIVEEFIISSAVGNSVYIESSFAQWSEMDRRMDEINEAREQKLVKIGWWHTHPSLGIFMSGTDRGTQARYFYQPWQFAAVFDPHAQKWGAFLGESAAPCFGTVQKKEGDLA